MGIMSKNNRLPERPKPPSWTDVSDDIASAPNNDVVFVLGQDYLATTNNAESSLSSVLEKACNSNDSEAENSIQDTVEIDAAKVKASKTNILKLIDLYTELTNSVGSLQDQQEHLKVIKENLSQSSSQLKALATNMTVNEEDKIINPVGDKGSGRGKSKQKKRK